MREILFKAKRRDNHEWIVGYYCKYGDNHCIIEPTEFGLAKGVGIIPETLCEYTQLKDKNGKRIFEGDICQIKGISYIDETPFIVEWNNEYSGWFWRELSFSSPHDTITPEIAKTSEIIGNRFDNPELLTAERIRKNENKSDCICKILC